MGNSDTKKTSTKEIGAKNVVTKGSLFNLLYKVYNGVNTLNDIRKIELNASENRKLAEATDTLRCYICGMEFTKNNSIEAYQHFEECILIIYTSETIDEQIEPEVNVMGAIEVFRKKLDEIRIHYDEGYVKFMIYRPFLLEDSLNQLNNVNQRHLRSEFQVEFEEEFAQDAGGLTIEWLNLISKEIIMSDLQLFKLANTTDKRYIISNTSCPEFFKLLGRVIGKAILSEISINCPLSYTILKQILNIKLEKEDIKYIDIELYKGMKLMESMPIEGIFFLTFSIEVNNEIIEFFEGGRNIEVNDENKDFYIDYRVDYELFRSNFNLEALKRGIFDVIPEKFFEGLTVKDLDFLICGNQRIDVNDWRSYTEYRGKYGSDHIVIRWFWEILHELSQEKLEILLQFVTGCCRVPVGGFEHLKTYRGESAWFCIESMNYYNGLLPRAHTCFNRMDLPIYPSKQVLKDALEYIMTLENPGFYLE